MLKPNKINSVITTPNMNQGSDATKKRLPIIAHKNNAEPVTLRFFQALRENGFQGETSYRYRDRLTYATDNSVYQVLPRAVVFPKDRNDIMTLLRISNNPIWHEIRFSPRGGGTGTNGQSLTHGIIVDISRHMNQIVALDLEEGSVTVQPGIVLDELNHFLTPYGVFFAPTLSTSSRATLGGMVGTDACGKGSRIYGKTSNHILELELVLSNGTSWKTKTLSPEELTVVKNRNDIVGAIHRQVDETVTEKKDLIHEIFPSMTRFMTGYNLAKVNEKDHDFNLNFLIAGSEGTLAMISEIKLKLTPLPKYKSLLIIKYAAFNDALAAAQELVSRDPAAIETIDGTILELSRKDNIWHKVQPFFAEPHDHLTKGINLVEFVGDDLSELEQKVSDLIDQLLDQTGHEGMATGFARAKTTDDINSLWELRKKGVGLLGSIKGERRPIPFVEDTAVPPEKLASYIKEFRKILEDHGLSYGMFGHVDAGCLHVRPALDMKDPEDEKRFRLISDAVKDLVKKYGGVIWGEHGKGFRSEYTEEFFGPDLYKELRKIKGTFDPYNRLNPGKIAAPLNSDEMIIALDQAPTRGQGDRHIPSDIREKWSEALTCNGNGACFNWNPHDVMCPSARYTRDRTHSPKGRADMIREWLRLLEKNNFFPVEALTKGQEKAYSDADFSIEVYEAMTGCLSCKGCSSQCPIKVDIPELKSKFLEIFHSRYRRPNKDYLIAWGEHLHFQLSKQPWLYNFGLNLPGFPLIMKKVMGMVNPPRLSNPSLDKRLVKNNIEYINLESTSIDAPNTVIIIQDPMTSLYEAEIVIDTLKVLIAIGLNPKVMPWHPSGKGMHVKGFLAEFAKVAQQQGERIDKIQALGIPIIGIEPAITLTYREEYRKIHGIPALKVQCLQEFLCAYLEKQPTHRQLPPQNFGLLSHCGEKSSLPKSPQQWQQIFFKFNLNLLPIPTGCCGMAGAFGHEANHQDESRGIYAMSWEKQLKEWSTKDMKIMATGGSCRSQVKRFGHYQLNHPMQELAKLLSIEDQN